MERFQKFISTKSMHVRDYIVQYQQQHKAYLSAAYDVNL